MPVAGSRVVVGVDGSDEARGAIAVARWLGERLGLPLALAHATPVPAAVGAGFAPQLGTTPDDAERRLAGARGLIDGEARLAGLHGAERVALLGAADEGLLELAAREDAAFIVLGSRGRGRISTLLLGSVSSSVAAGAACPVVVVPARASVPPAGSGPLVCAVDGSPGSRRALRLGVSLAQALGTRLVLAHAVPRETVLGFGPIPGVSEELERLDAGTAADLLERIAAEEGVADSERVVGVGRPSRVLGELAAVHGALLLLTGSRGHGPATTLLLGSVAHDLAAAAPCPVAILPSDAPAPPPAGT